MDHQFYDINKFRAGKGLLWFPISLARIENAQSAKMYFENYIPHITPAKITTPTIGANFCYGEWLYMRNNESASFLKKKYSTAIAKHKNEANKYIYKPQIHLGQTTKDASYYIPSAFSFSSWSSLYFAYQGDFISDLQKIVQIYYQDTLFQSYLQEDVQSLGRVLDDNQLMFFLEEHLMMYLIATTQVQIHNEYISNPEWLLMCYPGKPLKHHIYMMQKDFFKTNTKSNNFYKNNRYDLENKKIYDFMKIDLSSYYY